ncbi:MAG: SDR family NAD(P)-dependent oxidoreductase [bacterium]|nr:SDR family NAD(P)-dependent oxidoreductase [bacterium]
MSENEYEDNLTGLEIAVIGMTGRFPKAKSIDEFWTNLINGKESITFFTDEELREAGVGEKVLKSPRFVKAYGWMEGIEYFDASFFGYTPMDAELMDPQMRILHECALEALENAGYDPYSYKKPIGIYGGAAANFLWQAAVELSGKAALFGVRAIRHLSDKDFICTQVAYKLNLMGPVVILDTACSTSLVAVHMACQGLLSGDCDMALAGGVSIGMITKSARPYEEGMLNSPDGHTRTFDARAQGTNFGNGAGLVVLKRLEDALADRDTVHVVIKGSAVNNDGAGKSTYTAPGIEGQGRVIRTAHRMAEVDPETVGYVETHGTATALGDPVEVEGLKVAFHTKKKHFCRLGALKSNSGHLEAVAGIAGFLKTLMVVKNRLIPPNLFFETPNPKIDFENSPFIVNKELTPWEPVDGWPLRAGVSSFGIGGTNAHVVIEEAPEQKREDDPGSDYKLLLLSARSEAALEDASADLKQFLEKNRDVNLADAAYTLQVGRKVHEHRRMLVCRDVDEAVKLLASPDSQKVTTFFAKEDNPPLAFIFPDRGDRYMNIKQGLYDRVPAFREEVDRCFDIPAPLSGEDIKETPLPVFIFEYALGRLFMQWGIEPGTMKGVGIGRYVAACLSGAFSLEEALAALAAAADGQPMPEELEEKVNRYNPTGPGPEDSTIPLELGPAADDPDERDLLDKIGRLWLYGIKIDWTAFYSRQKRYRIPLPTYPFQRRRYWTDMRLQMPGGSSSFRQSPGEDVESRFYVPSWKRVPPARVQLGKIGGSSQWLVFPGEGGPGDPLVKTLREAGAHAISVRFGTAFEKAGPRDYIISPRRPGDYTRLVRELQTGGGLPVNIIHAAGTAPDRDALYTGFYSLIFLVQALGKQNVLDEIQLTVVSGPLEEVVGTEAVRPEAAMLLGAVNVIPQEYPGIGCRCIDIDFNPSPGADRDVLVRRLLHETASPGAGTHVAYRGGHRWIRRFEPVKPGGNNPAVEDRVFRERGVYLITGGTGSIGLEVARHLARTVSARLILTARTPLPPNHRWGDSEDPVVRKLKELENLGAEVLAVCADVSDEQRMRQALDTAEERFGPIDGVIHAAGIMKKEAFGFIRRLTEDSCERQFRSNLYGLPVLEKVLDERKTKPGFCLLMSSVSAVLGGLGCAAYSAANIYMGAFAAGRDRSLRWVCVDWDPWKTGDRDPGSPDPAQPTAFPGKELSQMAMTPAEGIDAVQRILEWEDVSRVIVSTGSLPDRVHRSIRGEPFKEKDTAPPPPETASLRPGVLEQVVADTWRESLGLEKVGNHTNFFDLGASPGDIAQVGRKLSKRLNRNIPTDVMFEYPSTASLAGYLSSEREVEAVPEEKLAKAVKRMENTFQRLKEIKNV